MNVLVHKVEAGPFWDNDEGLWVLVVRAQDEGDKEIFQDALTSDEEDSLWEIVRHLNNSIHPWVIPMEEQQPMGEN